MPNSMQHIIDAGRTFLTGLPLEAIVVWLIVLYLSITWVTVGVLSSIQFRSDARHGTGLSIDRIKEVFQNIELSKRQKEDELAQYLTKIHGTWSRINRIGESIQAHKARIVDHASSLNADIDKVFDVQHYKELCIQEGVNNAEADSYENGADVISRCQEYYRDMIYLNEEINRKKALK